MLWRPKMSLFYELSTPAIEAGKTMFKLIGGLIVRYEDIFCRFQLQNLVVHSSLSGLSVN